MSRPCSYNSFRIRKAVQSECLHSYTPTFKNGIWKYMFSSPQFRATNRVLLQVFPNKPTSTREIQYNNTYIFNELDRVNSLRNRIAHHEPICFPTGYASITISYIQYIYDKIMTLFHWLGIEAHKYLRGIDHVNRMCMQISSLS